jgi:protein arginine kinase activator
MICEICKKNSAKIHITQVKNKKKYTIHICHDCSHEYGIDGASINPTFSIEQYLSGTSTDNHVSGVEPLTHETCPSCSLSYGAFKESGRLGCSYCYTSFSNELKPLLQKIQKDLKHVGKSPSSGCDRTQIKRNVTDLRIQLKEAVNKENFELAAQLRDQIRDLESQLSSQENT